LDPFVVTLGETVTNDDNLFRAAAGSEAADWQSDTRLRVDYDDRIGRDHAMAWAAGDISRYRHNTQLDNENYQLGGQFDWSTLNRLSGSFGADDDTALYRAGTIGDQSFDGKSMVHTQRGFARMALGSTTPVGIEGGAEVSRSRNGASALAVNDVDQWVGDLGVTYSQSPDLRLSLLARRTQGKYPHFVIDSLPAAVDFHHDDLILGGNWTTGGFTSVQAQVAYAREDYSYATARHYWTGFARANWQVGGHVSLSASFARDTSQNFSGGVLGQTSGSQVQGGSAAAQTLVTQDSLSLNDAIDLSARWELASKIEVNGSYLRMVRRYDNVPLGSTTLNGSDLSNEYRLGLDYKLSRALRGGCYGTRSTRAAGDLGALGPAYVSNAYSCLVEFSLH
jgi:hypothetical protein